MNSVLKPLITGLSGRDIYAIDGFLSLSWLCWVVVKVHFNFQEFEPRKAGRIDNNFVGIITILSCDVDSWLRFFLVPLGGMRIDFVCWYTDKFPWLLRGYEV
jgi:hypothetical protein